MSTSPHHARTALITLRCSYAQIPGRLYLCGYVFSPHLQPASKFPDLSIFWTFGVTCRFRKLCGKTMKLAASAVPSGASEQSTRTCCGGAGRCDFVQPGSNNLSGAVVSELRQFRGCEGHCCFCFCFSRLWDHPHHPVLRWWGTVNGFLPPSPSPPRSRDQHSSRLI